VADVIAAWASRYLASIEATDRPLPPGLVEVSETRAGRYVQTVRAGRHLLVADEPVTVDGNDTGPGPYDYLLAALGACTSMTLRMYAERKGVAVERFSVRLSYRKIHGQDCADCETKEGDVGEITREISIKGDLPETVRQRLMDIADKCPVDTIKTYSGGRMRTQACRPFSARNARRTRRDHMSVALLSLCEAYTIQPNLRALLAAA